MRVVFLETVAGSGQAGEVKNVAGGYARNYLLPRKLAAPATPGNLQRAQAIAQAEDRRQARLDVGAQGLEARLAGKTVRLAVRVGEGGRLFGSVTSQDIAAAVSEIIGQEVDHRQFDLPQPIKELGEYSVTLRLTRNVQPEVLVEVVAVE